MRRDKPLYSDKLLLVPASELPFMDEWKRIVSKLPQSSAVIVMPSHNVAEEGKYKQIARRLALHGTEVKLYRARRG